jgi:hypothetical protein
MTMSNLAGLQVVDGLHGRVKVGDLDGTRKTRVIDSLGGTLGQVRAEDAGQIGRALEERRGLLGGIGGTIAVVVDPDQGRLGAGSLNRLTAALFALVSGADSRLDVLNVELARAADRVEERLTADHATLGVVGADVRQGECHWTVRVVAVADRGVHRDDGNASRIGALQWFDDGQFVNCRDDQRVSERSSHPRSACCTWSNCAGPSTINCAPIASASA